jgi:L-arabinose isomerase
MSKKTKVGLFGIGLDTYWDQFDGLLERLKGYQKKIADKIVEFGAEVLDASLVDSPEKAREAGNYLKKNDVEIVFLYVSTYALSSTVLPVAQKLKCPVIILNIQPVAAIDYEKFNKLGDRGQMTGEWLAHCQACSAPEIANVFNRAGVDYEFVTGYLDEQAVWDDMLGWIDAANVASVMRNNRLGVLGHYYGGMLDVYSDLTKQAVAFGTHMELVEMCELKKYRDEATDAEVEAKIKEFHRTFEVVEACEQTEIERAARTSGEKLVTNMKILSPRS